MLVKMKVTQLCPTLCDLMDYTNTVHGILQARILEWVAISSSRGSSQPRGSNPPLLHRRQILYCLSHQGSPQLTILCCILKLLRESILTVLITSIIVCNYAWCWILIRFIVVITSQCIQTLNHYVLCLKLMWCSMSIKSL